MVEKLQCMWRKESIPHEFKDASIVNLYKRKGNPQSVTTTEASLPYQYAGEILAKTY